MPTKINYITGDATNPKTNNNKIIVHICNDIGGWGAGFVLALSNRWKEPEQEYIKWFNSQENFVLGQVQFVQVEDDIWVANLIGQHNIVRDEKGNPPIRYDAILEGLNKVAQFAVENKASVHMPRIGCGLAGGKWNEIEPLINSSLLDIDIETYVYNFR